MSEFKPKFDLFDAIDRALKELGERAEPEISVRKIKKMGIRIRITAFDKENKLFSNQTLISNDEMDDSYVPKLNRDFTKLLRRLKNEIKGTSNET